MFCPNCGKSLPDNAKFCSGCGLNLQELADAAPAAPQAAPAPVPRAAKKKPTRWIVLAILLVAAIAGGLFAYRYFVTEPRDAIDYMIHCMKKSDAYESGMDFQDRLLSRSYRYSDAIQKPYGKEQLADYFSDLFRDGNYQEYIHDLSALQFAGYLTYNDGYTEDIIKDSALQELWKMGGPISPSDVSDVADESYADDQSGVYFRGVRIEDYDNVSDHRMFVDSADSERYCGIVTGHVYGSIFVWPVSGWDPGYILIDADSGSYAYVSGLGYSDPTGD